ncbi:hypothetical protein [Algibacter sp. PT7-4]|uniref:hypothetical protein n=1 Tax=Algibacter ulvanivorans TaxID=3400999 RepID=UPI003AAF0843
MANKRCCSQFNERNGGCAIHSKYKLVFQLKPEYKTMDSSPTFYSWVYQNNKDANVIFQGMINRLEKYFTGKYNKIEFYNQTTDVLIKSATP